MSGIAYWNPATDPDKPGGLEEFEWPGHVRDGGRTCLAKLTGTWSGDRICPDFLASSFGNEFSMICISPTHSMYPP
jgi:hypothetical protein